MCKLSLFFKTKDEIINKKTLYNKYLLINFKSICNMTIDDKKATNEIIEPYPNLISGALNHIKRFKNKILVLLKYLL